MRYQFLGYEKQGRAAVLKLDRPERTNALNSVMLDEIACAMTAAEADQDVRAIIVTGAGASFSSGFDLKDQMETRPRGVAQWQPILRKDFDTVTRFWHSPKPTIASVRGACLAGAFELMLACDAICLRLQFPGEENRILKASLASAFFHGLGLKRHKELAPQDGSNWPKLPVAW
jgi:enoyl-CoA hydratase